MDIATLAELLRETSERHDHYEKTHAETLLVGLVRALPKRASKRQQSGGGSRRRQPLYGRRPSCSGTMSL